MIGVVGYMSGGKSYFAVEHMLSRMQTGHIVVTNIQLVCQAVTSFLGIPCVFWKQLYYYLEDVPQGYHHLCIDDYESYPHGSPRGSATYERDMCYCYLDEASSIFDSMVHASDAGIQKVATWARHTEKRGLRIFLIMQFASELHKRLRVHITEYIACTNTSTVKVPYIGTGLPFFLKGMTIRSRYASDGETLLAPAKWYRLDPKIYKCYHTAQIVVGSNDLDTFKRVYVNYDLLVNRNYQRLFIMLSVLWVLLSVSFFLWGLRYE